MALNPPPIQEKTATASGVFPQVWILWLQSIVSCFNGLQAQVDGLGSGAGSGSDGVMDGARRIGGAALFDGGRRV